VGADRAIAAHPDLDDETLAQVEPVTVSLHAVRRSAIREGDTAVVLGAGPVGLTTLQCVRAVGAARVIVVEPNAGRRDLAAALGADDVVGPEAAGDLVRENTHGLGADLVYECAGGADTLEAAVALARRGGSVCLVAFGGGPISIEPGNWLRKEISVTTSLAYLHEEFGAAMELLADGRVRVDALHTSTTRLDGLGSVLRGFAAGTSSQLKVLVNPNWQ
jgi:(R,R)-butanediol dehydrogenase/meso-butanediol dehydrogenase/diacetyl reductase